MNKKITGGLLIGIALVFFFIGYMKTRPTMLEGFTEGSSRFIASVDQKAKKRMERNAAEVRNHRIKRGMPMFLIGGLLGIGGVIFITTANKK